MSNAALLYSEKDLVRDLQDWWDDQVGSENDPFAKSDSRKGTIFEVVPVIDSLSVLSGLVTIEQHVGFTVSPEIVRPGGYTGFQDMVEDLVPKVRELAAKHGRNKK
jgi:hypothetical protein